jgi:hypothetical protein
VTEALANTADDIASKFKNSKCCNSSTDPTMGDAVDTFSKENMNSYTFKSDDYTDATKVNVDDSFTQ